MYSRSIQKNTDLIKKIKQAIIESKEAAFPKEADLLTDVYINY